MGLTRKEKKLKSKLRLPRITMGSDESLNQSLKGGLEKISYMNSNGPLGNCCKVPSELGNRTCASRTKWRVYKVAAHELLKRVFFP